MDKEANRVINEVWKFLKKYLPLCKTEDEAVWDGIRDDSNAIYESTKDLPDYFRDMTSDMIVGACKLLEGVYREDKKNGEKC